MHPKAHRLAFLLCAFLALPVIGYAQETVIAGVVTDTTDAVLPGVTVTAQAVATGNTFTAVSDAQGQYRIGALRPGVYRITAELPGFTTVVRQDVELLLGQRGVINYKLAVSTVQESVTVVAEALLIDTTQSALGGNIDTRQMRDLPIQGRNWLDLTMMAPGSRVNSIGQVDTPVVSGRRIYGGQFQVVVDGQEVTALQGPSESAGATPKFSRDAIAEVEFVTSRFDATQGRASGGIINAVTKAGTNAFAGTVSGYFRNDTFNAKDLVAKRVLPYSNQQVSVTFGGPVRKDKVHFFGYFEGEHEPQTFTWQTQFARFNIPDRTEPRTSKVGGGRADIQLSTNLRMMARGNAWRQKQFSGGGNTHPSTSSWSTWNTNQAFVSLTQTMGTRRLNEVRVGMNRMSSCSSCNPAVFSPLIRLTGLTIGKSDIAPTLSPQETTSVRDDFTYVSGAHEIKLGGEFAYQFAPYRFTTAVPGVIDAQGGPIPANIEDLFPVWDDPSTWNLLALNPITRSVQLGLGDPYLPISVPTVAAWFQDNWKAASRLTLNLGVRWEVQYNALSNNLSLPEYNRPTMPQENQISPRLGFAYALSSATVIRGGWGKYYQAIPLPWPVRTLTAIQVVIAQQFKDSRPNFVVDPFNVSGGGKIPTVEEAKRTYQLGSLSPFISSEAQVPYAYQTSIGAQHEFSDTLAVQADYVSNQGRHEDAWATGGRNINLTFNPATGANYPLSDVSRRLYPNRAAVLVRYTDAKSDYHGLETGLTKRMRNGWQGSATYTLSRFRNSDPLPINLHEGCKYPYTARGVCNVPITVPKDLGGEYGLAAGDQRHRAVFNGIWELPYNFQLSGLYFFGSGQRFVTTYGGDLRDTGSGANVSNRLRPDGTIVPRNNFAGDSLHRVDARLMRRFRIARLTAEGMVEVFNLFNHANYGSYITQEVNRNYGSPTQNLNVAYGPRALQLGFRFSF